VTAIDCGRRLAAPRGCASGIRPLEAGTSVLIGCGCWLHREVFTSRFIITGTSVSDGTAMAGIGWEAAITAIGAGQLSCDVADHPCQPSRQLSKPTEMAVRTRWSTLRFAPLRA
jgi:hypothetical protein